MVHAFICCRTDYCISVLAGLSQVHLVLLQSILDAAVRLTACLPRFSHITTYKTYVLHWIPVAPRIQYKVLHLVSRTQQRIVPMYLCDLMRKLLSALFPRLFGLSIGLIPSFPGLGLPWLNIVPLQSLALLCGMTSPQCVVRF